MLQVLFKTSGVVAFHNEGSKFDRQEEPEIEMWEQSVGGDLMKLAGSSML